jgi:2,4-dienoyl-CoA reductase-like NADH-dependent reductase (Old Yellow Enzyme family)
MQGKYVQVSSINLVGITKDPLLQPFTIKGVVFKNRIMSTSHACGLEEGGMPGESYQRYHEEKAKGGLALTMFGGSSNVAPDSPNVFRQLNVGDDAIIPHLIQFSERLHRYGTKLMCQITHLGRRGEFSASNWLPTIGPSPVRENLHRSFPKEMDKNDIKRVVKAFGRAAERCKEGGLDGIEVMAASHLVGQFLSPKVNLRTDDFGGSLENRCRFGLLVFEEIRRRVGDDFLVGLRHTVDEGGGGWLTSEECLAAAKVFERAGTLDFINAIYGRMDTDAALTTDNMPGMASPIAPWLERVGEFKREIALPVFHAARISDIASARYAIRDGLLDMVAMTRAHIADPYIVSKLQQGLEHTIRPCVGATQCQSQFRPACIHNPSSGREQTLPHVVQQSKRAGRAVVIVGGGPAGLEAARVCAERGHRVVLFEATSQLGGQILMAARTGWRRDLIGIVDWRVQELERLGVEIRLNSFAEEEDVLAQNPDVVIVATGGAPDLDWMEGGQYCTSVWDAISGNVPLAPKLLVYDGTGRQPAAQFAEFAATERRTVHLISSDGYLGQELTYADRVIWKRNLAELSVDMTFDLELIKVARQGELLAATFRHMYTKKTRVIETQQIVLEHGTVPMDELYQSLRGQSSNDGVTSIEHLLAGQQQPVEATATKSFELHRTGDAVSSRNIHAAILDASRLCMAI